MFYGDATVEKSDDRAGTNDVEPMISRVPSGLIEIEWSIHAGMLLLPLIDASQIRDFI